MLDLFNQVKEGSLKSDQVRKIARKQERSERAPAMVALDFIHGLQKRLGKIDLNSLAEADRVQIIAALQELDQSIKNIINLKKFMGFETMPTSAPEAPEKKPEYYVGANRNPDGTLDYSQAAKVTLSEEEAKKLTETSEECADKEAREREEGFDWEKQLFKRFQELQSKKYNQGLSEHGKHEFRKLQKVLDTLQL